MALLRKHPRNLIAAALTSSAVLLAAPSAWSADSTLINFEPVLVAHGGKHDDSRSKYRDSSRKSDKQRRESPAVELPGIGKISARVLRDLALTDAQTQQFNQARDATRTLKNAQHDAKQEVRALRQQQLDADTLDPRALSQARQAAREKLQPQLQDVQNQWFALWDSLSAEQKTRVVQAVKRPDRLRDRDRNDRNDRGDRSRDSRKRDKRDNRDKRR